MLKLYRIILCIGIFVIGFSFGYATCNDLRNKTIHKQQDTINKQAKTIQTLEKYINLPCYIDSISGYN